MGWENLGKESIDDAAVKSVRKLQRKKGRGCGDASCEKAAEAANSWTSNELNLCGEPTAETNILTHTASSVRPSVRLPFHRRVSTSLCKSRSLHLRFYSSTYLFDPSLVWKDENNCRQENNHRKRERLRSNKENTILWFNR